MSGFERLKIYSHIVLPDENRPSRQVYEETLGKLDSVIIEAGFVPPDWNKYGSLATYILPEYHLRIRAGAESRLTENSGRTFIYVDEEDSRDPGFYDPVIKINLGELDELRRTEPKLVPFEVLDRRVGDSQAQIEPGWKVRVSPETVIAYVKYVFKTGQHIPQFVDLDV